jgi:hypothetical protein
MYKTVSREEFLLFLACMDFNGDESKADKAVKRAENAMKGFTEFEYAIPVL